MHGYKATDFAWEAPVTSSSERLVILALAKFSDDAGRCFPSVEKLTAITHLNRKTVFSALKALSQSGVVSAQKSERNANRYQLNYALCRTENGTTENGTTENGTAVVPKTGQPVVPNLGHEQISEHINEQIRGENPLPPPSPAAKREAQTHLFSLAEIPDASKKKPTRQQAFKPPELGVELTESAFRDWMTVRKAKHSPLTETAWKHFKAQVLRSELSIQQAVELCATKGWISINAEWQAVKDYQAEFDSRSSNDRKVDFVIKALGLTDNREETEK
nr:MAG TPA: Primosomal protein 1 [Caudoviricetes sp.]